MRPPWFVNVFLAGLVAGSAVHTAGATTLTPALCLESPVQHACGEAIVRLCTGDAGALFFRQPSGAVWAIEYQTVRERRRADRAFRTAGRACRRAR